MIRLSVLRLPASVGSCPWLARRRLQVINSILDTVSTSDKLTLLAEFYETTLHALEEARSPQPVIEPSRRSSRPSACP